MKSQKFTRGIANNNPGNIRHGSRWLGLAPVQNDSSFCTFSSMVYGIRALVCLLRTYHYKYDCNTLREVIYRYAPPCENNTWAYMQYVLGCLKDDVDIKGFDTDVITADTPVNKWYNRQSPGAYIYSLCRSICLIESRYNLDKAIYDRAVKLL